MKNRLLLAAAMLTFAQLSFAGMISTISIPVPGDGVVPPKGGSLKLPLTGVLIDDVVYGVTCHASNPNLTEGMAFKLSLTDTNISTVYYKVNGMSTTSQFNLTQVDNTITVYGMITEPYTKDVSIIFKNLDNEAYSTISQCTATPVT